MAEEQKERWLSQMALATVILAVCATLSTFKGGGYSTQSVISQTLASDQWAFFQAKSTKQHLHELQVEQLRLQALSLDPASATAAAYAKSIADNESKTALYGDEKKQLEAKAHAFESERDDARRHGKPFGLAVIFLQVAILLNSIAGLLKVRRIFWTALPIGMIGLGLFLNGFFLIVE